MGEGPDVDEHDEAILKLLQQDARHLASGDISEESGLSASTVRKRIQKLEESGVIKGYSAEVDYEKSGHPMRMILFCTAPIPDRGELVEECLGIDGVVSVQELVTGDENILVTAVGERDSDITAVAERLMDLGLTITDEVLVRKHETSSFEGFTSPMESGE